MAERTIAQAGTFNNTAGGIVALPAGYDFAGFDVTYGLSTGVVGALVVTVSGLQDDSLTWEIVSANGDNSYQPLLVRPPFPVRCQPGAAVTLTMASNGAGVSGDIVLYGVLAEFLGEQ